MSETDAWFYVDVFVETYYPSDPVYSFPKKTSNLTVVAHPMLVRAELIIEDKIGTVVAVIAFIVIVGVIAALCLWLVRRSRKAGGFFEALKEVIGHSGMKYSVRSTFRFIGFIHTLSMLNV